MGKFTNLKTGVVVSVADSKDERFSSGWKRVGDPASPSDTPDKLWKVADLKSFADSHGIELDGATKKDEILAAINAAPEGSEDDDDESEDESESDSAE